MPIACLRSSELLKLIGTRNKRFEESELNLIFYHLNLLVDEESGELEVPGEVVDQLRSIIIHTDNPDTIDLIQGIFGRSFGENLDYGFFD